METKEDNYSFRIVLSDTIEYGKCGDDVIKVSTSAPTIVCENMKDGKVIRIRRMEIIKFEFQMFSSANIGKFFLKNCTSLT